MSSISARNNPKVPPSPGDTQYNVRDAALRGASTAFSKPPAKPKPLSNTYTGGNNGALLAATKVGTGMPRALTPSGNTSPLAKDWTGGSMGAGRPYTSPIHPLSNSSSSSTLAVRDESPYEQAPSPSNIAAKLAAARYSPMKPLAQGKAVPFISERDANEIDVLPPPGSVGNVLARLDSTKPNAPEPKKGKSFGSTPLNRTFRTLDGESKPTDDTLIASTTSLVSMFEQSRSTTPKNRSLSPTIVRQQAPPSVRSPKPQRIFNLPPEPKDEVPIERVRTHSPPPVKSKPRLDIPSVMDGTKEGGNFSSLRRDTLGPVASQKAAPLRVSISPTPRPMPPPKRMSRQSRPRSEDLTRSASFHKNQRLSSSMSNHDVPSSPSSFVSACEEQEEEKPPKPSLPPPRRSARPKTGPAETENRPKTVTPLPPIPHPTSKMISPVPPPQRLVPPRRASVSGASTPAASTLYHNNYQRESVRAITKHLTGENLSSAIVGAALASSRNASPAPISTATPPPHLRRQQHHHHSIFHRSPSPPKPQPTGKLRPTMRREPSSSTDEDESEKYKRKGTRIMGMGRKAPNKHHEGTRKRWRDQITERERKRYEGVWAANKGLYISASTLKSVHTPSPSRSPSQQPQEDHDLDVLNLVVKDIWSRSRLPEHALEEVWDLVDGRGIGRLRREEFVVGLWLVDQRLKGRKLPLRVSESVWASVRGAGVKVKVGPHKSKVVH
jgi:hypothetical protein